MVQPKIVRYANTPEEADAEIDLIKRTLDSWELSYDYTVEEHFIRQGKPVQQNRFTITFTLLCETEKSES